jgi:hypothetical protein
MPKPLVAANSCAAGLTSELPQRARLTDRWASRSMQVRTERDSAWQMHESEDARTDAVLSSASLPGEADHKEVVAWIREHTHATGDEPSPIPRTGDENP